MKLYAPKYYKEFRCIADKCRHSCCIGWEIDIDSETMEKYAEISHAYGKTVIKSIDTTGVSHFRLCAGEKCPHLNEKGLCNIILNLGEGYLCDVCREHPRFYNDTNAGKEVGIGMACEEAARIILGSDDYGIFMEIGGISGEASVIPFDGRIYRKEIYGILSDNDLPYKEKLSRIYSDYSVSPSVLSDGGWREALSSLEYLDGAHKMLFSNYSSEFFPAPEYEKYLERALAYFIFRHCTEAEDEDEFRISLGFCLFCERLLASLLRAANPKTIDDIILPARILSEEIEYSEDNTETIMLEFSLK